MKAESVFSGDKELLDFNFWPSFSDLMLSLVLILCLVLSSIYVNIVAETVSKAVNIESAQKKQREFIRQLAAAMGSQPRSITDSLFTIGIPQSNPPDSIVVECRLDYQLIRFGSKVIFDTDNASLNAAGIDFLLKFGPVIRHFTPGLREIQIQGHADERTSKRYESNIELAAARAISVFNFLQDRLFIDPAECRMSICSYGEYNPLVKLSQLSSEQRWSLNRRIEIFLFYRM